MGYKSSRYRLLFNILVLKTFKNRDMKEIEELLQFPLRMFS